MKKLVIMMMAVIMGVMLIACGSSSGGNSSNSSSANNSNTTAVNNNGSNSTQNSASDTKADDNSIKQEQTGAINNTEANGSKILVAYFSATHTTEGVAKKIADNAGADIYEIKPADPYTSADLNYNDKNSRSTKEMNDASARPAISGNVTDMSQYSLIFVGYPIWWGEAPRIINTFLESYDLTGKTIIPFCTSGGSGLGNSGKNLSKSASGAVIKDGKAFTGSTSDSEIKSWVDSLNIK